MGADDRCPICRFRFTSEYFVKNEIMAKRATDVFDCPGCGALLVSFELDTGAIEIWEDSEVM